MNVVYKTIRSFLWVLPFISFLAGYQFLRMLSHVEVVEVPQVIGLHMHDAIKTLSSFQLNVRILAEREDLEIPEGIIISQTPLPGAQVKPHQSIFLVITRRPPKPNAPSLFGTLQEEAMAKALETHIHLKTYQLESIHPLGTVIAQNILPGYEVSSNAMIAYVSSGITPMRLFPHLKGHAVSEVTKFFETFGIKVEVAHPFGEVHDCSSCIVIEQRPLAGTFIDLKKTQAVHVTVETKN